LELILWRHADAETGYVDSERALTGKGEKQAAQMAKWLRARMPENTIVLASPAKRAQQTARALTPKFKTVIELGLDASAEGVLRAAGWPDADGAVMIVGHQPTLGETAALVLSGKKQGWPLKKGAVMWVARGGEDEVTELRAAISPGLL
jgi:phosphohistidine phosphatase